MILSLKLRPDLTFDISSEMNEICLVSDYWNFIQKDEKLQTLILTSENSDLIYA